MARPRVSIAELIDSHYDSVYRYAYRLCGSVADAEDLTQATFSQALVKLDQLREPEKSRGWLYQILRNKYLRRLRDGKQAKSISIDSIGEVAERPSGEILELDASALQAALNELDESFRTPLILFYFEEFSYREIAEQLNLPLGTVMSRLARGKNFLRSKLRCLGDYKDLQQPE